ncbi:MAG: hypothetical protein KatS3mg105_0368 [Gemmatales bacterium]|nr:MAG: hypothetical protein KatS3mg105_0368 [Gemmatales bacterium]
MIRYLRLILAWLVLGALLVDDSVRAGDFRLHLPKVTRPWIGPAFWSNPLQDWRIHDGRIESIRPGSDRHVHLLTHRLGDKKGGFELSVRIERLAGAQGSAGFRVGIRGPLADYRNALLFGKGLDAGITTSGQLFIGKVPPPQGEALLGPVDLVLAAMPAKKGYNLKLSASSVKSGKVIGETSRMVSATELTGNVALVSNFPVGNKKIKGATFAFSDWRLSGDKVEVHPEDVFGPILFAMHTLSRGVMKMTAQMPPIAESESQAVALQIKPDDAWQTIAEARIDPLSRTATFRVPNWNDKKDIPYRLAYAMTEPDGSRKEYFYTGTVRRDPVDKPEIVVAGFTGHQDYTFPCSLMCSNITKIDPDVLVFTGDQIYENNAGYGIVRSPVELAALDYLRKWYVFGWSFRDVMRDRVTLCLPDDHDVYQGNIWGQNGRKVKSIREHAQGGYAMDARWVNAIQRMQSSHHPDPYDPTPVEQGITVYYGPMTYGRISFAVIEDRKFKSGPEGKVNYWKGRPDHVRDPKFKPESVDKPGLTLLGERQLKFLRDWAADWRGADMKIVCSQTIFANVANYHGPEQQYLVADLDSNGWPQTGRNKALHEMRRGFAFHLAGDQHLASIVHHGIDTWRDAGFSFCVPSIAAGYPRSWHPEREGKTGKNRQPDAPPYTGDFLDGLGNHITVYAVGNPEKMQRSDPLGRAHDKASGFGVVRLNKKTRKITMECWRLLVDVSKPRPGDQFPGWPMTIDMLDNYGRKAAAYLPTVEVQGMQDPVVQIIDEADGDIVYTLRIKGNSFRPKVFKKDGTFTIKVGDPDVDKWKILKQIKPAAEKTLKVRFE